MLVEEVAQAINPKPTKVFTVRIRANLESLRSDRAALHRVHPQTGRTQYKFNNFRPSGSGGDRIRARGWQLPSLARPQAAGA